MSSVLHLLQDEKISNDIIKNFISFPNQIFIIFSAYENGDYRYVQNFSERVIKYNGKSLNELTRQYNSSSIIFHALHGRFVKLLQFFDKKDIKVVWIPWGFDIYNLPRTQKYLFEKLTRKIYLSNFLRNISINEIKKNLKNSLEFLFKEYRVYNKIDFFCSYILEDYIFFSKYYPNKMKYAEVYFSDINQYLANITGQIDYTAKNILVGNSNTLECNHIDAFNIISKKGIDKSTNIIVPLNYGDNDFYKQSVIKEGQRLFDNFVPLIDFMKRYDYITLIKSCSTGIFFHRRQQAMGNIIPMLYLGIRVYLNSDSPVLKYLRRNHIIVFDLERDFPIYGNKQLLEHEKKRNQDILIKIFGKYKVEETIKNILKSLYDE